MSVNTSQEKLRRGLKNIIETCLRKKSVGVPFETFWNYYAKKTHSTPDPLSFGVSTLQAAIELFPDCCFIHNGKIYLYEKLTDNTTQYDVQSEPTASKKKEAEVDEFVLLRRRWFLNDVLIDWISRNGETKIENIERVLVEKYQIPAKASFYACGTMQKAIEDCQDIQYIPERRSTKLCQPMRIDEEVLSTRIAALRESVVDVLEESGTLALSTLCRICALKFGMPLAPGFYGLDKLVSGIPYLLLNDVQRIGQDGSPQEPLVYPPSKLRPGWEKKEAGKVLTVEMNTRWQILNQAAVFILLTHGSPMKYKKLLKLISQKFGIPTEEAYYAKKEKIDLLEKLEKFKDISFMDENSTRVVLRPRSRPIVDSEADAMTSQSEPLHPVPVPNEQQQAAFKQKLSSLASLTGTGSSMSLHSQPSTSSLSTPSYAGPPPSLPNDPTASLDIFRQMFERIAMRPPEVTTPPEEPYDKYQVKWSSGKTEWILLQRSTGRYFIERVHIPDKQEQKSLYKMQAKGVGSLLANLRQEGDAGRNGSDASGEHEGAEQGETDGTQEGYGDRFSDAQPDYCGKQPQRTDMRFNAASAGPTLPTPGLPPVQASFQPPGPLRSMPAVPSPAQFMSFFSSMVSQFQQIPPDSGKRLPGPPASAPFFPILPAASGSSYPPQVPSLMSLPIRAPTSKAAVPTSASIPSTSDSHQVNRQEADSTTFNDATPAASGTNFGPSQSGAAELRSRSGSDEAAMKLMNMWQNFAYVAGTERREESPPPESAPSAISDSPDGNSKGVPRGSRRVDGDDAGWEEPVVSTTVLDEEEYVEGERYRRGDDEEAGRSRSRQESGESGLGKGRGIRMGPAGSRGGRMGGFGDKRAHAASRRVVVDSGRPPLQSVVAVAQLSTDRHRYGAAGPLYATHKRPREYSSDAAYDHAARRDPRYSHHDGAWR